MQGVVSVVVGVAMLVTELVEMVGATPRLWLRLQRALPRKWQSVCVVVGVPGWAAGWLGGWDVLQWRPCGAQVVSNRWSRGAQVVPGGAW